MIPTIPDQGSEAWLMARVGHATTSKFKEILATTKSGPSSSRKNYAAQLVCERITKVPSESFSNDAMKRGTEKEPFARDAFCQRLGKLVIQSGFLKHPTIPWVGCSPDALIEEDGLLEIKCPNTATHIATLLNGMDPGHRPQVQGQMWITGRHYCQFVSFDDRLPEKLRLYVERIKRDDAYIATLETEIVRFLAEVDAQVESLLKLAA